MNERITELSFLLSLGVWARKAGFPGETLPSRSLEFAYPNRAGVAKLRTLMDQVPLGERLTSLRSEEVADAALIRADPILSNSGITAIENEDSVGCFI